MIAITTTRDDYRSGSDRTQNQLRRLLVLVDVMAPMRRFKSVDDVQSMIEPKGFKVCKRTVQRDLDLLASLGFIESCRMQCASVRGGTFPTGYRLNLRTTEGLQVAALKL